MRKRVDQYAAIKQRLNDWGDYRRNVALSVGWNVHMLDYDAEVPRGIQKRNDTYSNPVLQEYERMRYEQKRNMTTDTVVTELRPRWMRRLIIGRHKRWPDISDAALACKLGLQRRDIKLCLGIAYDHLIEDIAGLNYQRNNAA